MSNWKDELPGVGVVCEGRISVSPAPTFKWVIVEILKNTGFECAVYDEDSGRLSWCDEFRPIKKREPLVGEVWLAGALFVPCIMTDVDNAYPIIELDGSNSFGLDAANLEYAAPSVKAYYARELLEVVSIAIADPTGPIREAARLGEE